MDEEIKERKKHFDSIFGTDTLHNIDFNNLPLLKQLFEYFEEDIYKPSPKYEELRKKHIEVADLLEQSFTEAQQTLFEKYWEIENEMSVEESQQLFYFRMYNGKRIRKRNQVNYKRKSRKLGIPPIPSFSIFYI